jgi:pimeloyl-ACP methyl ester carboxylesterase
MGPIIDVGSGPAIVLIPGIQGRWEWMRPSVDALAARCRVVTSSLPGEPGCDRFAREDGFDQLVQHVDNLMDTVQISSAVICGVSFGGLVALRYAARRSERVRALILVSAPGPSWKPAAHQARYMRRPTLSAPFFALGAAKRVWSELKVTLPDKRNRLAFCAKWALSVMAAPAVPWRMGHRARLAAGEHFEDDCPRIKVPTLVIAGERELDKVVRPDDTMGYVTAISGAQFQRFEHTGHLGTVSAPERFAAIVSEFVKGLSDNSWPISAS